MSIALHSWRKIAIFDTSVTHSGYALLSYRFPKIHKSEVPMRLIIDFTHSQVFWIFEICSNAFSHKRPYGACNLKNFMSTVCGIVSLFIYFNTTLEVPRIKILHEGVGTKKNGGSGKVV